MAMTFHDTNLRRLRRLMEEKRLDAFLVSVPENRYYVSGFSAEDPQIGEISGFVLIGRDTRMILTDGRYVTQARQECPNFRVLVYSKDRIAVLQEAVTSMRAAVLGVESHHLTVSLYDRMAKAFQATGVRLQKEEGLIESLRVVKETAEQERIVRALRITEQAFQETVQVLRPGMSEREAAWNIRAAMYAAGADQMAFDPIVASGPNAALPHAEPTDRKIRQGEPVLFDIGARKDRYCSDMSRTVYLGNPDSKFREVYKVVREAQVQAVRGIRAGMMTDEADALARSVIEQAGFGEYFVHSLGHGVGLAVHEAPPLSRREPVKLEEGMVITVEPGIYLPDWGGVRLEEMVVVGREESRVLNRDRTFYEFT